MDILLHVSFEQVVDEKSEGDVAHARKMKYLHSVDDLGWRHKNIYCGKVLAQTMADEYATAVIEKEQTK